MTLRQHATIIDAGTMPLPRDGVERLGPGRAPTAFRIWRAGENVADDGSIFFTEASAEALMAEQASRARPYSIDFDHLSLVNDRPADAGRAAGWHALGIRTDEAGTLELWAENVEWTADVKAGLEQDPPLWRFFSPAFRTNDAAEVTSYVNLALCINPMTHGIPLLASTKQPLETKAMTAEEQLALLDSLIEAEEDADKKAALVAAREALAAKKGVDEDPADDDSDVVADAEKSTDDVAADNNEDEKKKASAKQHSAKGDPALAMALELQELRARVEAGEVREAINARTDLDPSVRKWCMTQPLATVRGFLATVPRVHSAKRSESPTQGKDAGSPVDVATQNYLDEQMGMNAGKAIPPTRLDDGRFVMHTVRPADAVRFAEARKGKVG